MTATKRGDRRAPTVFALVGGAGDLASRKQVPAKKAWR